jgi:myo-inositol-1(or 4)-monophosphatase
MSLSRTEACLFEVISKAKDKAIELFYKEKQIHTKKVDSYKLNDVVTNGDYEVEKVIIDTILSHFPKHQILSEELGGKGESEYKWIIDPIDGTINFAHDNPNFSITVALEYQGKIISGAVCLPIYDETYFALTEETFVQTKSEKKLLKPSETKNIYGCMINGETVNFDTVKMYKKYGINLRCTGSAAIDCCYLASGKTDGVIFKNIKPWDVAAGILLIERSGGQFLFGTEDHYATSFYATNAHLKDGLEKALSDCAHYDIRNKDKVKKSFLEIFKNNSQSEEVTNYISQCQKWNLTTGQCPQFLYSASEDKYAYFCSLDERLANLCELRMKH